MNNHLKLTARKSVYVYSDATDWFINSRQCTWEVRLCCADGMSNSAQSTNNTLPSLMVIYCDLMSGNDHTTVIHCTSPESYSGIAHLFLWFLYCLSPPVLGLREEKQQAAHLTPLTWVSHIHHIELMGLYSSHQSINQSINQPINKSSKQSINPESS